MPVFLEAPLIAPPPHSQVPVLLRCKQTVTDAQAQRPKECLCGLQPLVAHELPCAEQQKMRERAGIWARGPKAGLVYGKGHGGVNCRGGPWQTDQRLGYPRRLPDGAAHSTTTKRRQAYLDMPLHSVTSSSFPNLSVSGLVAGGPPPTPKRAVFVRQPSR